MAIVLSITYIVIISWALIYFRKTIRMLSGGKNWKLLIAGGAVYGFSFIAFSLWHEHSIEFLISDLSGVLGSALLLYGLMRMHRSIKRAKG